MLVGAAVGVVAVTVVIIIAHRRRKRKKVVLHAPAIAMSNLVYGGNTSKLQKYTQSAVYYFFHIFMQLPILMVTLLPKKNMLPAC